MDTLVMACDAVNDVNDDGSSENLGILVTACDAVLDLDMDKDFEDMIGLGNSNINDMVHFNRSYCTPCSQLIRLLSDMRDHIVKENNGEMYVEPVLVFPLNIMSQENYRRLKSDVRRYRPNPPCLYNQGLASLYCTCDTAANFHRETGKCSMIVIALSFAYHTSNLAGVCADHQDVVAQMENNYNNWKHFVESQKPGTQDKKNQMRKVVRYNVVLSYNRRMFNY
jgi:hypothetical protein